MEFPPRLQKTKARRKSKSLWLTPFFIVLLLLSISCDEGGKPLQKSSYTGAAGEVILVIDKHHWQGKVGDMLRAELNRVQDALPQDEPILEIQHIPHRDFNELFKRHRNIIIIDVKENERNEQTRTEALKGKWAKGQLVFTIHAFTEEEFAEEFEKVGKSIADQIVSEERIRLRAYHEVIRDPALGKQLMEQLSIDLTIPRDYKRVHVGDHFALYQKERILYLSGRGHDVIQGLVVYEWPYYGEHMFTPEYIAALRDTIFEDKVLSSFDSPMIVEQLIPPLGEEKNHLNNFAYECRGLWKFERPFMGGPFVNLTMVDEKKGRIVGIDGYVFAPKFDKLEFVREMESILYSVNF